MLGIDRYKECYIEPGISRLDPGAVNGHDKYRDLSIILVLILNRVPHDIGFLKIGVFFSYTFSSPCKKKYRSIFPVYILPLQLPVRKKK